MSEGLVSQTQLGSITDTNVETLPPTTPPTFRFHYIDLSSVERGFIKWSEVGETTYAAAPTRARRVARPNDALFGTVRPNLQSHGLIGPVERGPLVASTGFTVVRSRKGISHPAFIFHSLMSNGVTAQAIRHAVGSSYPALNDSEVKRFEIFAPAYPEQAKIALVLDTLDIAIQQTEAIIGKHKAVKQGLLHDLLTRGIDANGELRPQQVEAPHLYQMSPLKWIPTAWGVEKLEAVSSNVTSGSRDWARFYAESGALFVRIGNLTRENINFRYDSVIFVRPPRNADGQRTRLELGDILVSITADLGIVGVVPAGLGEAYINQHIALVRPDTAAINPRFVGHYMAGHVAQTFISKLNDSGAKAGLNLPTIRGLPTVVPKRDEQDQIATRLDQADRRVENASKELEKLRKLKAGLMDDLLSGRIRVTSLLEQSARTVLEPVA
jgi:type I restriction enzyme S subunit